MPKKIASEIDRLITQVQDLQLQQSTLLSRIAILSAARNTTTPSAPTRTARINQYPDDLETASTMLSLQVKPGTNSNNSTRDHSDRSDHSDRNHSNTNHNTSSAMVFTQAEERDDAEIVEGVHGQHYPHITCSYCHKQGHYAATTHGGNACPKCEAEGSAASEEGTLHSSPGDSNVAPPIHTQFQRHMHTASFSINPSFDGTYQIWASRSPSLSVFCLGALKGFNHCFSFPALLFWAFIPAQFFLIKSLPTIPAFLSTSSTFVHISPYRYFHLFNRPQIVVT